MKTIDRVAKGRGYAMAQAKVTRHNGTVEYHVSRPQIRWWDVIGWVWYVSHLIDLRKRRI